MANLFPGLYTNEEQLVQNDTKEMITGYHHGSYFDFETGDYKRSGTNTICESTGVESWEQWCIKCLNTQKYSCAAYYEFGVDYEAALSETDRDKSESILIRSITEALLNDPYKRTLGVNNIKFDWTLPDSLLLSLTIIGIENVTKDITVKVGGV